MLKLADTVLILINPSPSNVKVTTNFNFPFYTFYSNPRSFLLEKVTDLETLLKKRCGSVLPPTHQGPLHVL